MEKEKAFISYLNDDDKVVQGYFEIIEINGWKISFKSGENVLTLPLTRILKIKERLDNDIRDN